MIGRHRQSPSYVKIAFMSVCLSVCLKLFMAALCNRAGHTYFHPVVSFFFLFPRLISAVGDWMSAILPHMVCLSVNLECRSETCWARLAENIARKNRQKLPSGHHPTILSGYIFATKAYIDNRKKLVEHQYLLHMFS